MLSAEPNARSHPPGPLMPVRSNSKNRCERCRMYRPLCLCPLIPQFHLDTKVLILKHWREEKLTTNTAHLASLILPHSEIHLRGVKNDPLQLETLIAPDESVALLFPTEDAIELTPETIAQLPKPLTLVVPDGSWGQAKKVATREKALNKVPRVKIPLGLPSQYRLRFSPHEQNLCTFEAIARAIGALEGKVIQEKMEELFIVMVERILWSRGVLKPSDCTTPIPEAAFEASRIAGIAGGTKKRSP